MKACAKKAVKYAESHGYTFESTNTKGIRHYRSTAGHEVGISPGLDEHGLRKITSEIDRAAGIAKDRSQKHRPDQIRLRAERQRELDRLRALAREKRKQLLDGAGAVLSDRDVDRITREIEAHDRQIRELERLMRPGAA